MLIYFSLVDIFGVGCRPVRTEMRSAPGLGPTDLAHHADNLMHSENSLHEVWNDPERAWPHGFVSLLYHADEQHGLKISMSYVVEDTLSLSTDAANNEDWKDKLQRWEAEHCGLRHPSTVLLLTAWRPVYKNERGKEGVLRAERLCPIPSSSHSPSGRSRRGGGGAAGCDCGGSVIPIAKAGVGCASASVSEQSLCWLCGSSATAHWPDLPPEAEEKEEEVYSQEQMHETGQQGDEDRGMCEQEQHESGRGVLDMSGDGDGEEAEDEEEDDVVAHKRPRQDSKVTTDAAKKRRSAGDDGKDLGGKKQSSKPSNSQRTTGAKKDTSNDLNRQLLKQNSALETELNATKELLRTKEKECVILVRKFDKRFAKEMETRRGWNAEKRILEAKLMSLEGQKALVEARAVAAESQNKMLMDKLSPLLTLMSATGGGGGERLGLYPQHAASHQLAFPAGDVRVNQGDRGVSNESSDSSGAPGGNHFCVVCQAHTADTVITSCGHLCLCFEHAVTMQTQGRLTRCPLCNKPVAGICRAVGVNG
jgi:hypothetical protein